MEIDEGDKKNILINLLNERYNASHKIRERSLSFTLWILGFAIAFVWILLNGAPLIFSQKVILTILVLVLGIISFWFLFSLERGFEKNRRVMIDTEEALGCYEKGLYINSKTLFPTEYKKTEKKSIFSHFRSIYILLIPVAVLIICLIWLKPTNQYFKNAKNVQDKVKIEKTDKIL